MHILQMFRKAAKQLHVASIFKGVLALVLNVAVVDNRRLDHKRWVVRTTVRVRLGVTVEFLESFKQLGDVRDLHANSFPKTSTECFAFSTVALVVKRELMASTQKAINLARFGCLEAIMSNVVVIYGADLGLHVETKHTTFAQVKVGCADRPHCHQGRLDFELVR